MDLNDYIERLNGLPQKERVEVIDDVIKATADKKFIPSPGPQTEAWFSKADVLLYGGEAGGGKSGLLCGLALEEHHQSLLMRRNGVDLEGGGGLIEDLLRLYGSREGYSGKSPPTLRTTTGRTITFGSASNIGDEQKYQGRARDLLGVDEATQFAETQIRFLLGWVRTVKEGQRTRSILATNPPISSVGDWIIGMFRPWLDVTHPNPAKHGELRYYITTQDGDFEVDGPEPVQRDGETLIPTSRTFIPAKLKDNPFIVTDDYQKQLDALPEPYRSAARDGNFMASRQDAKNQIIPTQWIMEAQERWTPDPPEHAPMSSIAADIAQGGADTTTIAARYDGWFAPIEQIPGKETPTGNEVAGALITHRRNGAEIVIDMGGGWGSGALMRLNDSGIKPIKYVGSKSTGKRTVDQSLGFYNTRTMAYWRLREALDPSQDGGSPIALPPDPELVSDLTAPTFEIVPRGIKALAKEKVVDLLGRSPDKGDAAVMCWFGGPKVVTHGSEWRKYRGEASSAKPKVINSRMPARRRR